MMESGTSTKKRGFIPARTDQERLLMKRAGELAQQAQSRGIPRYSGFLSDREQDLCQAALNHAECDCARFWGGYPGAERKILCIEPPGTWQEQPWECLCVRQRFAEGSALQHKDYLGAVLGLGLDRSCIGDICLSPGEPDCAYLFVTADKAEFLCREFVQAGRAALDTTLCGQLPDWLEQEKEHILQSATVASLRLDSVIAAMLHCSRAAAAELIAAGRVEVNHILFENAHAEVFEADVFTVRGKGRFRLSQIGGKSRKDRIYISYFQY